jgi:DNA-binding winged helix-turn-helix (wHTH) protein
VSSEPFRTQPTIRFGGDFEFDPRAYELRRSGRSLKLERIPLEILLFLIEQRDQLVTREQIAERIWGKNTFLDTDNSINGAIRKIRQVLNDDPENSRFVQTVTGRGYRFVAPTEGISGSGRSVLEIPSVSANRAIEVPGLRGRRWLVLAGICAALMIAAITAYFGWSRGRAGRSPAKTESQPPLTVPKLTEKDIVVLADFENKAHDPVFDYALKQGLSVELTQSPFFNVASDVQVGEILRRMGRSRHDRLTLDVGKEVCSRIGGKAILAGSISTLGKQYVVGLQAISCADGEILAAAQTSAANKESVLKALDSVTSQVRGRLGETLPSLERYNFPIAATTKSLEALKAFSSGLKTERDYGPNGAIPFYRYAIQLDPDFALAYATLGRAYEDFGEDDQAVRNYARAFELRDRLSEREKYFISTLYYESVPGDLQKAKEVGELWTSTYPRDEYAREKLATVYNDLGETEKAYDHAREALRLDPESEINVFNAAFGAITLDRMDEASRILQTAQSQGLDGEAIHLILYPFAFRRGDTAGMERQVAWSIGKAGLEADLLCQHSETEAYYGRFREAQELSRRSAKSAMRAGAKEMAATCALVSTLVALEIGRTSSATEATRSALTLPLTRNLKILSAFVLARTGEATRARELIKDIENKNPSNTLVNSYWEPTIAASLDLDVANPQEALSELEIVAPYELSQAGQLCTYMYPTYLRGQAYLATGNGRAAAAEFKKILDHPGIVLDGIVGALARLQLGRAYAMSGDAVSAKAAYQNFLALWKDADPDIPILMQAKAEYAKLQ